LDLRDRQRFATDAALGKIPVFAADGQAPHSTIACDYLIAPEEFMKLSVFCLFFFALVLSVSLFLRAQDQAHSVTSDREKILQLERDWTQSFVTMDVAANQRIVADDFFGTEPDGKRSRKADLITEVKTGEPLVSNHLNEEDITIRFYDQTAVVNGSETWKRKDGKTGRWIWTDVFVKRKGTWQVVASQDLEALDK
jgi:hypothetical protein